MTEKLQLTQEEKRIKIAEALGWRYEAQQDYDAFWRPDGNYAGGATHDPKRAVENAGIPDFFGSLDAMHEADKVLRGPEVGAYHIVLEESVGAWPWHATAPQRAEAFGKALNLWI